MPKQNSSNSCYDVPFERITRARAAASRANGAVLSSMSSVLIPEKKRKQGSKRAASDENSVDAFCTGALQPKRRAVLKDVTNVGCENSSRHCIPAAKLQSRVPQQIKVAHTKEKTIPNSKSSKIVPAVSVGNALNHAIKKDSMSRKVKELGGLEPKTTTAMGELADYQLSSQQVEDVKDGESICATTLSEEHSFRDNRVPQTNFKNECFTGLDYIDIDTDHADPRMCCDYVSDVYTNLHAAELIRRPFPNFMETIQRDINQNMRGILIDWLIEVAEEYRLVPDTLYLTVYIIDRYLSKNYIEIQRLQLLGITSMLIASKYEEICAPRVEEFCFITDNTYSKAEVLKMETVVLNYLSFQLSVPTIKTFLRRYLRAAQASIKAPTLTLGYLANYLAELTLVDYSFIKFFPSVIAASAIFIARWTLDQSNHPWNQTLEHYTSYKAMDLKNSVFALQELQLNSKNCPLSAVREKYRQQKFESVATFTSPKLLQSLFQ